MSKATIKMCMSSTGFGSQVRFNKQPDDSPIVSHRLERSMPPQPSFTSMPSRPPPRFDDSWNDLFPETWLTPGGRNPENQPRHYHAPQSNPTYAAHRSSVSVSDTSSLSTSTGSLPMSIAHQRQQHPPQYDTLSQTSAPLTHSNSNDPPDYDGMYDFDFLMSDDAATFTGDSGLNLGFDGHHDWADGGSAQFPDLFGGFFFGGSGSESTAMDAGTGYPITGDYGDAHSNAATSMWTGAQDGNQ